MEGLHMVALPWGGEITYYAFLMAMAALCMGALVFYHAPNHGAGVGRGILFVLLSGVLGLFLGRAVYCGVYYEQYLLNEQGQFIGWMPFFDPNVGSVNVIGVILGVLLAALLAGIGRKGAGLGMLDSAALPGTLLFAFARFIEPLSGAKNDGIPVTVEWLKQVPFAAQNSAGEWMLSVCYLEAALAVLVLLILFILRFCCKKNGTLGGVALALLCATQFVPEFFRQNDALFLFGFIRVTQIGYAAMLAGVAVAGIIRGGRRGMGAKMVVWELFLLLLCLGVCAGGVYALEKLDWPAPYIYYAMIAALVILGFTVFHRLVKEDRIIVA